MNNNYTYEIVKKKVQKKIIDYLYKDNDISIIEYELLNSKFDDKISKLNSRVLNEKEKYNYSVIVDIII